MMMQQSHWLDELQIGQGSCHVIALSKNVFGPLLLGYFKDILNKLPINVIVEFSLFENWVLRRNSTNHGR